MEIPREVFQPGAVAAGKVLAQMHRGYKQAHQLARERLFLSRLPRSKLCPPRPVDARIKKLWLACVTASQCTGALHQTEDQRLPRIKGTPGANEALAGQAVILMVKVITDLFTISPELANCTDAGFIRLTRSRPKLAGN